MAPCNLALYPCNNPASCSRIEVFATPHTALLHLCYLRSLCMPMQIFSRPKVVHVVVLENTYLWMVVAIHHGNQQGINYEPTTVRTRV